MSPQREAQLLEQLRQKDEENARLRMQIKLLEQKIDLLVKRVFGASSEKLDAAQLQLLLAMEEPGGPKGGASGAELEAVPQKRHRAVGPSERKERLPEHLPVEEVVLDPPEVSLAPQAWRCIGQEVSEQLDYEPARFVRRRLVRRKWVKREEAHLPPLIAPLPPVLQERCLAAPGLLAQIITAKFCDHLPIYRQEQMYVRGHGVVILRQTMVRWLAMAAQWCELVYQQIRTGVMGGGYVQLDETPIRYLSPGNGKCALGYLWTARRPGVGVFYRWHASRAATCLDCCLICFTHGLLVPTPKSPKMCATFRTLSNGECVEPLAAVTKSTAITRLPFQSLRDELPTFRCRPPTRRKTKKPLTVRGFKVGS